MAFLCPVRIRKNKKKKESLAPILNQAPTRITGSSSIETLLQIGLEKPHPQVYLVLHDFTPCVDDELEVKRGDIVSLLYREHDWAYVLHVDSDAEGFIPFSYLDSESTSTTSDVSAGDAFLKDAHGRYIVLYSFNARDENDLSVTRGEILTVLNKDDPDWFWVFRSSDSEEGFVPSAFVFPYEATCTQQSVEKDEAQDVPNIVSQDGTELVMLYDYKAQAPDDLSVKRGDWVYADMNHQTVEGWLWAFAPKHKKYGFIPKAYARPPAMTSL